MRYFCVGLIDGTYWSAIIAYVGMSRRIISVRKSTEKKQNRMKPKNSPDAFEARFEAGEDVIEMCDSRTTRMVPAGEVHPDVKMANGKARKRAKQGTTAVNTGGIAGTFTGRKRGHTPGFAATIQATKKAAVKRKAKSQHKLRVPA